MDRDERRRRIDEFLARGPIDPSASPQQRSAWFDEAARINDQMVTDARERGEDDLADDLDWLASQARLEARRAVRGLN
jgi:hypothetical protein